jgi:hypothetical protein
MIVWLLIASVLIVVHETGHLVVTRWYGGSIHGIVFRGIAVGIRVDLTPLSFPQKAHSIAAGLLAETLVAMLGVWVHPTVAWPVCWGLSMAGNALPWWSQNDGSRWLAFRQASSSDSFGS